MDDRGVRPKTRGFSILLLKSMVQTKDGAATNPWIEYMRACAANYRAGQTQHHSVAGKGEEPADKTARRRIVGKQPASANAQDKTKSMAKPVAKPVAKPMDAKAMRQLDKVVKATAKARVAKAKEAAKK